MSRTVGYQGIQISASEEEGADTKNMRQWAGPSSLPPSQRLLKTQNEKQKPRGAVRHRTPQAEEEDPRVKCKHCGAFGHTARSRRCPMKCSDGALVPEPLGPKQEKENQAPRQPEHLQNTGSFKRPERQKDQGQRQEEQQRKALLQTLPERPQGRPQPNCKKDTEPSAYLRQTSRTLPIRTTWKSSVLGHVVESQPPVKNTDERPTLPTAPPFQRNALDLHSIPVPMKGEEVAITSTSQPAGRLSGLSSTLHVKGVEEKPEGISPNVAQPASERHGLGQVLSPHSTARCPDVSKQACLQPPAWRAGQVPIPSIRVPTKRHAQHSVETSQNAPKKVRLSPSLTAQGSTGSVGVEVSMSLQPLPDTSGLRRQVSPQVTKETPPEFSRMDLHPPNQSPVLNPVPAYPKASPLAASCVPRQPLRMLFRRLYRDCWSSGFLPAPPASTPRESSAPAPSAAFLDKAEGCSPQGPVSSLYEDLQVSSSSEDSDRE